ncbi:zinc knuckle CX2CX4HX4C containing protein, partial [Tanacetum coccineum]
MWSRTGFKEIMDNGNGRWLFKFNNEQGMNSVAEQSPWMVNSKPLMVYKWDPSLGINKVELTKIPVWVKLLEVPMEAWSTEEISAISSRPLVMDNMTAYVCKNGTGRTEFARVLMEMEASKGFKEEV